MDKFDVCDKKKAIVATTWEYLLRTGLGNASIGELCRETKLAQSSLYYWFENKDDIWIAAGKYGLSKVVDALFTFTLNHTDDVRRYFDTLLDEVEKYKYELRLAIQITTSPVFGERMRDKAKDFRLLYEKYAEKIMDIFGCTHHQAEVFIYTIIASVIDYAIWDDREKTQMLLENLYERTVNKLQSINTINISNK
jgi:AcrR family transcriptional regulator